MKSSNLFRFVSVRPPGAEPDVLAVKGMEAPEEVVQPLVRELERAGGGRKPSEVRAALGAELLASIDRHASPATPRGLLRARPALAALIADPPALDEFRSAATAAVSAALGEEVDLNELISEQLDALNALFWRGYLGNLLSVNGSPEAREAAAALIRTLCLLEASRSADEYARLAPRIARARPAVPPALLKPDPPTASPRTEPEFGHSRIAEWERIREEVVRLGRVRRDVERISAMSPPPLRLTADDLRDQPEVREVLDQLGVPLESTAVPDLFGALERRVAVLRAKAESLGATEKLSMVGGTLRRTVRRIGPMGGGDDGR